MKIVKCLGAPWKENLGRFEAVGGRSAKKPRSAVMSSVMGTQCVSGLRPGPRVTCHRVSLSLCHSSGVRHGR